MTLPAYGFYWFLLADPGQAFDAPGYAQVLPDFITLTTRDGTISGGHGRSVRRPSSSAARSANTCPCSAGSREGEAGSKASGCAGSPSWTEITSLVVDVAVGGAEQRYFLPLSAVLGARTT